jgi:tight adherence protein B
MTTILIGAAALAVVALLEGLYYAIKFLSERQREDLQRRLQAVTAGGSEAFPSLTLLRTGRLSSNPFWAELLGGVPLLDRMATLLEQAQVGGTVAAQLVLSLLLALAGAVLGLALRSPVMGALLFVTGGAVPTVRLFAARARRSRQMSEQLPAALDMMARSLRAGHSLTSAFKLVASEMPGPINLEFARAYEEQNLGVSFHRAVQQMTDRVPDNSDLQIFAVSVIVQKETGGNLVEMLEKLADTIRARYQFYGKLAALTAEGQMSGLVLGALPIATALFLMFVNLEYVSALVTKPMGRIILAYTIISWAVGLVWLRQMAKVEL